MYPDYTGGEMFYYEWNVIRFWDVYVIGPTMYLYCFLPLFRPSNKDYGLCHIFPAANYNINNLDKNLF